MLILLSTDQNKQNNISNIFLGAMPVTGRKASIILLRNVSSALVVQILRTISPPGTLLLVFGWWNCFQQRCLIHLASK